MNEVRVPKSTVLTALLYALAAQKEDQPKIAARLALLNRMGFPVGANTGRGYRGGYSPEQLWQTVMGFKLLQVGLSLSTTIEVVKRSWDRAYIAIAQSLPQPDGGAMSFYWLIEPVGLENFELDRRSDIKRRSHEMTWPVETVEVSETCLQEAAAELGFVDFTAINVATVTQSVLAAFDDPSVELRRADFLAGTMDWLASSSETLRAHLKRTDN